MDIGDKKIFDTKKHQGLPLGVFWGQKNFRL